MIRAIVGATLLSAVGAATSAATAAPEDDVLQQAVNYAFLGRVDPAEGAEIVDRKTCVVILPDPRFKRYVRYYLGRFKLNSARFTKRYSGARTLYDLEVEGDDVILEYLTPDKRTVMQGYRTAHILLPGDIEPTQKALQIISDKCKAESPRIPF